MAAERAHTIATTIHNNCQAEGHPRAASIAPQSAKGSANTECSHLIISRETRTLWRVDTGFILTTEARRHGETQKNGSAALLERAFLRASVSPWLITSPPRRQACLPPRYTSALLIASNCE